MNRRVFVALSSLFVAVMLAGCGGDVPPVTVEPTEVPPTAVLSPTPTLVPTAPPSPTPTEVPLYSECGRSYWPFQSDIAGPDGESLPTGMISEEYRNGPLGIFRALGCLIGVEGFTDPVFSTSAIRIQVGFYDAAGNIHIYPVVLGGEWSDGSQVEVGFCSDEGGMKFCRTQSPTEILQEMQEILDNPEGSRFLIVDLIQNDRSGGDDWPATYFINSQAEFFASFQEALKAGRNFPAPPRYAIFGWQIEHLETGLEVGEIDP